MTTERKLYEIEVGLARLDEFSYVHNIVVFNVNGSSSLLPLDHECDVLVMSRAGHLTEIEIKRSWEDFKADFRKAHGHSSCGVIGRFFYCVPEIFLDKVIEYLQKNNVDCSGVIGYNEEGQIRFSFHYLGQSSEERWDARKLYLEQRLYLARLGCMRVIGLKEKLLDNEKI